MCNNSNFTFNFSGDENEDVLSVKDTETQWFESEKVSSDDQVKNFEKYVTHAKMFLCGDLELGYVAPAEVVDKLGGNLKDSVLLAERAHSDLVSGKYEGGLKIWECTNDLLEYLLANVHTDCFENSRILDLGCGAGLLGIYALMHKAMVTFQDYNREILEHVTIPNVLLNIEESLHEAEIQRCTFYSGDWASFNDKIADTKFDMILTSETIYNPENYNKIIELLVKRLKTDGVAYIAAKTHYFGVGGGTRLFESALDKRGMLQSQVCWKSSGGIQREIIKVIHKT